MAAVAVHPQKRKLDAVAKSHKKKTCARSKKPRQEGRSSGLFSRLIDSGVVPDHAPVFYRRKRDGSAMKEGKFTRSGILCDCCDKVFLLSKFEVHAGSSLHRPSANTYLGDGRSVMECLRAIEGCGSIEISGIYVDLMIDDGNDNICQVCGDAGELMLCDACPSAFHKGCLGLKEVPEGDWRCKWCRCIRCGSPYASSDEMLSCAHCLSLCHSGCSHGGIIQHHQKPWFCNPGCQRMWMRLRSFLGVPQPLLEHGNKDLSLLLIRSSQYDNVDGQHPSSSSSSSNSTTTTTTTTEHADVSEQPSSSSRKDDDNVVSTRHMLAEALKVFREGFNPVVDSVTKINFLSQAVYSKRHDMRRLDCRGFYTVLLMKGEAVVSAATVRVHGGEHGFAEMPFVATRSEFRQQGMCKALVGGLERMLQRVEVKRLVLPSIPDMVGAWTGPFGFIPMTSLELREISDLVLMAFPGTVLLQKKLCGQRSYDPQQFPRSTKTHGIIRIKFRLPPPPPQPSYDHSTPDNAASQTSQPVICH